MHFRYKKQDWQSDTNVKPYATLLSVVLWNFNPYNHTFEHVPTNTNISGQIVLRRRFFLNYSYVKFNPHCCSILHPGINCDLKKFHTTRGCFHISFSLSVQEVFEKNRRYFFKNATKFSIILNYLPLESGVWPFIGTKLESPSSKDALFYFLLKLATCFWRRRNVIC